MFFRPALIRRLRSRRWRRLWFLRREILETSHSTSFSRCWLMFRTSVHLWDFPPSLPVHDDNHAGNWEAGDGVEGWSGVIILASLTSLAALTHSLTENLKSQDANASKKYDSLTHWLITAWNQKMLAHIRTLYLWSNWVGHWSRLFIFDWILLQFFVHIGAKAVSRGRRWWERKSWFWRIPRPRQAEKQEGKSKGEVDVGAKKNFNISPHRSRTRRRTQV